MVGSGSNGVNINFENPYITSAMANSIYGSVENFLYTPSQVKWRGNPAVQAGDIVAVLDKDGADHTVLVMSHSLKIGGGLNDTIECKGTTETVSNFTNNFETTAQKIERVYKTLEQAIIDSTNKITGNSGGYVELRDTNGDGKPDEILILDTEDVLAATKVWRWNKSGLGYAENASGNAYAGPYRTAITADGKINADFITTGSLDAERITVGDANFGDFIRIEDGVMVFGEKNNELKLKLENEQVAFYDGDKRIAYFSNNSFEIENITEGKIRFQNFGFIPRASGNLTFTKLT